MNLGGENRRYLQVAELRRFTMLIGFGLLYSAYFVLRYGGLWTENDTSAFSYITQEMLQAGNVFFRGQYVHGFAYPAWMGSLSLLTGLPPYVENTIVMPFVGVCLFISSAYIAYRVLFRSTRLAFWATALLFAVPDLMFSVVRGNHEKINIAMLLWLIFVAFKSFNSERESPKHGIFWILLLYLFTFLNASANDYFASTLTVGLFIVSGWMMLASKRRNETLALGVQATRLWLITGTSWLLIFWVMFFVFPPAGKDFQLLGQAWTKVIDLFLTFHASSNPYSIASQQWRGPLVDFLGKAFRWLLSLGSFAGWVVITVAWIVRRSRLTFRRHFLLALYGGLGFLIAASVPVDFVGLSAGSNLELRNFTYFSVVASPMFILTLVGSWSFVRRRWPLVDLRVWLKRTSPLLGMIMAFFIAFGLLKVTLDPAISNIWINYGSDESQAMSYFLKEATPTELLWAGNSDRLSLVAEGRLYSDPSRIVGGDPDKSGTFAAYLLSPYVRESSVATGQPLPHVLTMDRIYQNGDVQLYRPRFKNLSS